MAPLKLFTFFFLLLLPLISSTKPVSSPVHEHMPDPQKSENIDHGEGSSVLNTNPQADPQASKPSRDPQESENFEHSEASSVQGTNLWADTLASKNVESMKMEMDAVGDNISAVYIVRKINQRATALIKMETNARGQIMFEYKLNGDHDEYIADLKKQLEATQTARQRRANKSPATGLTEKSEELKKLEQELTEAEANGVEVKRLYNFWMRIFNESKLPYKEINRLKDELAGALKEEQKMENYLIEVNAHIDKFREQKKIANKQEEQHPDMPGYKICHELSAKHLDFLEQIRLEVQLHYEFKFTPEAKPHHYLQNPVSVVFSDFQAFMENAQNLEKLVADKMHGKTQGKAVEKGNWFSKKLLNRGIPKKHKKVVEEKSGPNQVVLDLNNVAKKLYLEIAKAIEWPFKNEEKFVDSIVDVAEIANEEEGGATDLYPIEPKELHDHGGIVKAKNYLESLFNMHEAVQSIWQSLPSTWQTELHDKIRGKVEMPREWYSMMHAGAYPNMQRDYNLTDDEEMLHMRVELLLAKTLLVYERLDRFYEIDFLYQLWKKQKIPEGMGATKIEGKLVKKIPELLKTYFDEFEKKRLVAATVAFPSAVNGQHSAPTSLHG